MGLFSSKKKTYRDLSYARLIEDEYLPDVIGQAITTYVLDDTNEKPLVDLMIEYGWKSNAVKWNTAYRWASTPGKYAYGVPRATVVTQTDFTGAEDLTTVLQQLTGQSTINYIYNRFDTMNMRHALWALLIQTYSYNATSNRLLGMEANIGAPVYLYDAKSFYTPETYLLADPVTLEHWGFSPDSGATQSRERDTTRDYTPDGTSSLGGNYTRVEYTSLVSGVERLTTVTTTETTVTTRTPNGSGGYDDETTTSSNSNTSESTNWNGHNLPEAGNISSQTETVTGTETHTESDPPNTTTVTDPTTGVITITTINVSREITTQTVNIEFIAWFNMSFGQYDYESDWLVDTTTVLDERDEGRYDPDAVLIPSGESLGTEDDFFQVLFTYPQGDTDMIQFFTYRYGSGDYPDLDGITSVEVADFGRGFPRMYFRIDGRRLSDGQYVNTHAYQSSKRFGQKLDIPWLEVLGKIYQSLSSLDKIRDVLLIQCIPANTSVPIEREYLFQYFKTLYNLRNPWTDAQVKPVTANPNGGSGGGSSTRPTTDYDTWNAHIGATLKSADNTISVYNDMNAIGYRKINGTFGAKTASGREVGTRLAIYKRTTTDDRGKHSTQTTYRAVPVNYHYYRVQTEDNAYEEVRVYELTHKVDVGGKGVSRDGDSDQLMVPLDYGFRQMFSPHERETLYARAAHVLICTEYTVKSKWYQSGIFKAVMVVVAVVLAWWTGGASLTLVGAVTAVATAVGAMVIMSLLSKYVFSKLGGSFAIIATIVAVAVAIYTGYLYLSSTTGPFSVTAVQMMQVSNVAFQAAQASQKGMMEKEMAKMATLQDEMDTKNKELERAQKELANPYNTIEDNVFLKAIQGYAYLGETPQEYFGRTLNTNIGVGALELPQMYLQQSLSLPSNVEINQRILQTMQRPFELLNPLNDELNQ